MKNRILVRSILVLGVLSLAVPSVARAQFPGDVFFAEPSIAVPEGGTGTFEVLLFSGAEPVGATHFEVVFDPALAEVVAVEPGTTPQLVPGPASDVTPGRAAVVDLNGRSLTQPIGTSSLARLRIRPLASAGTRIPFAIQVRSLLGPSSTPLRGGRGFSGEIVVVSPGSQTTSASAVLGARRTSGNEFVRRAHEFRRPGASVEVLELRSDGDRVSAVSHRVVAPDPGAPSEAPDS